MSPAESPTYQPRHPTLVAGLIFVLAALAICAPMLAGRFLLGNDQFHVGYGFRAWGAEMFQQTGHIPQWNPLQFGGMPFIAAMHGDIFYPTAWLRWFLPIDTAMNIGLALHIVLAGISMFFLLRGLRLSWTAAIAGGVAYELSGIVVSMVNPGHDGKLYVSALAPLAFLALLRAIRGRRMGSYGFLAVVVGLCMLTPHYQMTYYLLVACGLWTLFLVFFDPERPADIRWPVPLALAGVAVVLGIGISGLQAIPFLEYIPFSPRGAGGPSAGWEYATSYAFPVKELPTIVLPQFNGFMASYWGGNFLKDHTEYLGVAVVTLATLAFGAPGQKRLLWGLGAIAILFLLVAFGAHTPFYRAWYEVMPMMKKVRAPGMAFYLVALVVCVYAAIGVDRLLKGEIPWKRIAMVTGVLAAFALLGILGALKTVAEVLVVPEQTGRLAAQADAIRGGALRMLLAVGATALVLWVVHAGRIRGLAAAAALAVVIGADLWSIDRLFLQYRAPAGELFRSDPIIEAMKAKKLPFRVFDTGQISGGTVYDYSLMMAHGIPSLLGYHGNEVRFYDDLMGGKNVWQNALNLGLWDLMAVRYLIVRDSQPIPGFHIAVGPVATAGGETAYLYEQDSVPPYVRVTAAAATVPEERLVATVSDPRFPVESLVLYSDTASVRPEPIQGAFIPPAPVTAELTEWAPGRMTIRLTGTSLKPTYLLVSETWYPDWSATVDGSPAPVLRGDHALISVVVPPGAKEVALAFDDDGYRTGKLVSLVSSLLALGLVVGPAVRHRKREAAGV